MCLQRAAFHDENLHGNGNLKGFEEVFASGHRKRETSDHYECIVWSAFGQKSRHCTNTDLKMEGKHWMEGQRDTKNIHGKRKYGMCFMFSWSCSKGSKA